jgi:voltage-gated potassium channel
MRNKLRRIIFGVDTRAGRLFDIILLLAIVTSVLLLMLETVDGFKSNYSTWLAGSGWTLTILFTLEYIARIYSAEKRLSYAGSFFGVVDLLAIAPAYLALAFPGAQYFLMLRLLRVLRIFRIFEMAAYVDETRLLLAALRTSTRRILVFLLFVLTMVTILGTLMYSIEGAENTRFSSIPKSVYWAIVTLTTVGYGDISPQTPAGQGLAAIIMIMGYSLIVVPTGFISVAVADATRQEQRLRLEPCACCDPKAPAPEVDAVYCKRCGRLLADR